MIYEATLSILRTSFIFPLIYIVILWCLEWKIHEEIYMLIIILFAVIYLVNHRVVYNTAYESLCKSQHVVPKLWGCLKENIFYKHPNPYAAKSWYHMQIISFIIADRHLKLLNKKFGIKYIILFDKCSFLTTWDNFLYKNK